VTLFVSQAGNLKKQRASEVAGVAAIMIATAVLMLWWVSLPLPSSWGSSFATVKPMTALCLAALGLAIAHPGKNSRFAFAIGLAVLAFGTLDLLDRFGIDTGINRLNYLLVPRAAVLEPETSFRMINGVPVALALAGGSLALSRFARYHFAATELGALAGFMQVFGLLCVAIAIILRIGAMPALRNPRPLWHLLIMLGCAIIAPLLLFGVYTGIRITDAQLREVRSELMTEARGLSADVDREIGGEIKRLQALAASSSLRHGDFSAFQRQAEASLGSRRNGNVRLVDRNMQQLVRTWAPVGEPLEKAAVPESVERALATGKPQVTRLFLERVTQQLRFAIVVPVEIDGESRFALVGSPDRHAVAALVATSELPVGWQAAVSDAAHRIVVGSNQREPLMGPRAQWRRPGPGGVSEFVDSEGRPSVEAYVWSELTGWETAVWAPRALLEAPVRALWWTIGLTALAAFALVLTLASWLGRLIARSVGQAARAATTLGTGDLLPPGVTPVAEVNTLMTELREAAARRREAENDLQASKGRLQVALDATQLGWWQYDPLRRTGSGDARAGKIFDFDIAENAPVIEELLKRAHPDDAEKIRAAIASALDPADPRPLAIEYRVLRSDGKVCWVENHGLSHFEGAGPERRAVSFVGTVADITERKEREEKEHLLMREINHRAKNMLSVVDAIAH